MVRCASKRNQETPMSDSSRERKYPEMSDVIPIKCETCRFWTMTDTNEKPWGYCGGIRNNSAAVGAYMTDDMATALLHTLPHFSCALWKEQLPDSDCVHCGLPIFFNGCLPVWQHKATRYAACDVELSALPTVKPNSKWAEPKEKRP